MTYAEHAEKNWDWMKGVGYISEEWNIYDGANVEHNCTNINKAQYSYNAGVLIQGLAFMYNSVSLLAPAALAASWVSADYPGVARALHLAAFAHVDRLLTQTPTRPKTKSGRMR